MMDLCELRQLFVCNFVNILVVLCCPTVVFGIVPPSSLPVDNSDVEGLANTTKFEPVSVDFIDQVLESKANKDGPSQAVYVNRTVFSADGVLLSALSRAQQPVKRLVADASSCSAADAAAATAAVEISCEGTECRPSTVDTPFVAILQYPNDAVLIKSVVSAQVQQALLWGASAVILLAMNADHNIKWHFDVSVTKPIVLISRNISKIVKALTNSSRLYVTVSSVSRSSPLFTKLTLWAQCGRLAGPVWDKTIARYWGGTFCLDVPAGTDSPSEWLIFSVLTIIITVFVLLNGGIGDRSDTISMRMLAEAAREGRRQAQAEKERRQLAVTELRRLPLIRLDLSKFCELAVDQNQHRIVCAICLDDFCLNQILRALPCNHRFHKNCVDPWLVDRSTCPLCKRIVIELPSTDS